VSDETYVEIKKPAIKKIFDKEHKKAAAKAMLEAIAKSINKAKGLRFKKGDDKDGFAIDSSLANLAFDEKKKELKAEIVLTISTWPQESMFAFPKGSGKIPVDKVDKIERDVEDLVSAVMTDIMEKQVVKLLQDRAKSATP
jgi:hypothetical protein